MAENGEGGLDLVRVGLGCGEGGGGVRRFKKGRLVRVVRVMLTLHTYTPAYVYAGVCAHRCHTLTTLTTLTGCEVAA
jgi:hypothetical protein